MTTRLVLPPGIGDIAFAWTKLAALPQMLGEPVMVMVPDHEPHRAEQFVELLPGAKWGGYYPSRPDIDALVASVCRVGKFDSSRLAMMVDNACEPQPWKIGMRDVTILAQANTHLENGKRIEAWEPRLERCYLHIELNTTDEHRQCADRILGSAAGPVVGIYTATYFPVRQWGFWEVDQWVRVMRALWLAAAGNVTFVLIGAHFDTMIADLNVRLNADAYQMRVLLCVGEHFGVTVEVLKRLNCLFAFPSGVPIVASMLRVPTMWWLPPHLEKMTHSFDDPIDVAEGRLVTRGFESYEAAVPWMLHFMRTWGAKR